MATKKKKDWRTELSAAGESLRDPFRMRLVLAGVFVAVLYFAVGEPSHRKLRRGSRELTRLKTQIATAEQVSLLESRVQQMTPRLITGSGTDPVLNHMMVMLRNSAADLLRMDAESVMRIGPHEAIRVQIELRGSFEALDNVLHTINHDAFLLRIDSFSLAPDQRDPSQMSLQLSVLMLKELK